MPKPVGRSALREERVFRVTYVSIITVEYCPASTRLLASPFFIMSYNSVSFNRRRNELGTYELITSAEYHVTLWLIASAPGLTQCHTSDTHSDIVRKMEEGLSYVNVPVARSLTLFNTPHELPGPPFHHWGDFGDTAKHG